MTRLPFLLVLLMSGICFGDVRVVTSSAPTTVSMNDKDDVVVQVSFIECLSESTATVTCPPAPACPAPDLMAFTTGPFRFKSATSNDCGMADSMTPNGTLINKVYVNCPQ